MKPLINSPGHLRALEDYIKFLPNGPREEIAWTLGQGWNLFLTGKAVMEATWGDLPTLAQDPKTLGRAGQDRRGTCARRDRSLRPDQGNLDANTS